MSLIILRTAYWLQGRLLLCNLPDNNVELFLHVYKINLRRKKNTVAFFLNEILRTSHKTLMFLGAVREMLAFQELISNS